MWSSLRAMCQMTLVQKSRFQTYLAGTQTAGVKNLIDRDGTLQTVTVLWTWT
jgi:hypothetical protein